MIKEKYGKHTIYRNDWFEFCTGWHKLNFKVAPAGYFDNRAKIHFTLGWGQFFLTIPFIRSKYDECDPPKYGFYFYSIDGFWPTELVMCLGRKNKTFYLPWNPEWVRTSRLSCDETWFHERREDRKKGIECRWWDEEFQNKLWKKTYPYTYTLKDGTIQDRLATVTVEEREWRPRWFMWTDIFSKKRRSINVEFDQEVGERTGSWKGGVTGCGYDLKPLEHPYVCLLRMQEERKFN